MCVVCAENLYVNLDTAILSKLIKILSLKKEVAIGIVIKSKETSNWPCSWNQLGILSYVAIVTAPTPLLSQLHNYIAASYKVSRDVSFKVFIVNWPSVKFSSSKFYWQNFGLYQSESRILSDLLK